MISNASEQRKAVIKNADMDEQMQQDAVDIASKALSEYNIEKVRTGDMRMRCGGGGDKDEAKRIGRGETGFVCLFDDDVCPCFGVRPPRRRKIRRSASQAQINACRPH